MRDLGKDDYASLYQINSIDSVLMFIPIEPALLTLYNEASDIIEKAWQKKIEFEIKYPKYIRDNIPINLLAKSYVNFLEKRKFLIK